MCKARICIPVIAMVCLPYVFSVSAQVETLSTFSIENRHQPQSTQLPRPDYSFEMMACSMPVAETTEEPNPATAISLAPVDDGPFSWLWEESTTTKSIHEYRANKEASKSNTSWLDIFAKKRATPKSPTVDLGELSPFAKKKPASPEPTMWQTSKHRLTMWHEKIKESTQRGWSNLKHKMSVE